MTLVRYSTGWSVLVDATLGLPAASTAAPARIARDHRPAARHPADRQIVAGGVQLRDRRHERSRRRAAQPHILRRETRHRLAEYRP